MSRLRWRQQDEVHFDTKSPKWSQRSIVDRFLLEASEIRRFWSILDNILRRQPAPFSRRLPYHSASFWCSNENRDILVRNVS